MRLQAASTIVLFGLLLGLAPFGAAQQDEVAAVDAQGVLWVAPLVQGAGLDQAAADSAAEILLAAFAEVDGLVMRDAARATEGLEQRPAAVGEGLNRAGQLLVEGREHLLNLALDEAFEAFQSARVIFRRNLAWMQDVDPLLKALLGLAEVLAAQGDEAAAVLAFREVLSLSPDYEADPRSLPGKTMSLFDAARAEIEQVDKGGLVVESKPSGAGVTLDGLALGDTPLLRDGLPPGLHGLCVQREGFAPFRQVIEIKSGEIFPLNLRLEALDLGPGLRALRASVGRADREEIVEQARSLAGRAGVAAVLLSRLFRLHDGTRVLTMAVIPGAPDRAVLLMGVRWPMDSEVDLVARGLAWRVLSGLRSGLGSPVPVGLGLRFGADTLLGELPPQPLIVKRPEVLPLVEQAPIEAVVLAEKPVPVWGRWWFWTGVGVLVAGGVATALVLSLGPEKRFESDPDLVRVQLVRDP